MWLEDEEVSVIIRERWAHPTTAVDATGILCTKLRRLERCFLDGRKDTLVVSRNERKNSSHIDRLGKMEEVRSFLEQES